MRLAVDTNLYRDLCDGHSDAVALLENATALYVPFVVLAELRAGFALGTKGRENERTLRRFLGKPGVDVLFPTDATIRAYADLFRQLRTQGTPIPTHDVWIAALVVEHQLALATRDRHFAHLPQITVA